MNIPGRTIIERDRLYTRSYTLAFVLSSPSSSPSRIASISATGSPKLEFPKFDGSSIRDKIDQRVANRGVVHFIGHLYIYSFYSLPFYLFPPSFNRRSNFLHDFSNFSKHACRNDQSKRERSRDCARGRMEIGDDTRSRFNYHVPLDGRVIISAVRVGRGEEKEGNIRSPG